MNRELMIRVRDQITQHPETHDQAHWGRRGPSCGTTRCIAGWAVHFGLPESDQNWEDELLGGGAQLESAFDVERDIELVAADLLGISYNQADKLFFEWDNVEALALLDEYIEAAS